MIRAADLPDTLPVFPLPGAVLLPRARLPLHIFEPRYLAMIEDCLKSDRRLIGMIQPRGEGGGLAAVGCAGRLTSFSETEDGRYMITLSGQARFTVLEEIAGFVPYRRARVDWTQFPGDLGPAEADKDFDRAAFLQRLGRYLRMVPRSGDPHAHSATACLHITPRRLPGPFSVHPGRGVVVSTWDSDEVRRYAGIEQGDYLLIAHLRHREAESLILRVPLVQTTRCV